MTRKFLDCGGKRSATPLFRCGGRFHLLESPSPSKSAVVAGTLPAQSIRARRCSSPVTAFTLTELLVVMAILTLLAVTQLPALTRAKAPVKLTQCLNNLRQIGQATMLYTSENNDCYPYGHRCNGPGIGVPPPNNSVLDPNTWPQQLLPYFGMQKSTSTSIYTNQPGVYLCPSEKLVVTNWGFQLHFWANRHIIANEDDWPVPVRSEHIKQKSTYMLFMEKHPADLANIRPGFLGSPLWVWNYPPGVPSLRRHDGRCSTVEADGHVELLLLAPYFGDTTPAGDPPPRMYQVGYFIELGDTSGQPAPASSWPDSGRVKVYFRRIQAWGPGAF